MSETRSLVISKYFDLSSQHSFAQTFWIVSFSLLTAIGAQIEIPHAPVPYTFQSFFVLLAGSLLGKRNGFLSMTLYLGLGIMGLPVFSGGGFGMARILGPTGGYLIAFPLVAFVVGFLITRKRNVIWTIVSMTIGMLILFGLGTLQLGFVTGMGLKEALVSGFLIFSWWDLLKVAAAVGVFRQLSRKQNEV